MEAVYIHIPFCKRICSYCDFPKVLHIDSFVDDYLDALHNEIMNKYDGERISTIYVGGGTPSCLSSKERVKLFRILTIFNKTPDCEFTFECNPMDINESLLDDLVQGGVNRVSIGVQSFDINNLKFMERNSEFDDINDKLEMIRRRGIDSINIDLMYAIPGEKLSTLKKDLAKFVKLKPTHISTYSLIIEDHTKIKNQNVQYISEDLDAKMYETIVKYLEDYGYKRYEVSNFSLEGFESKHNLNYWDNGEYYGFGLGASGFIGNVRYTNTRNLHEYIRGNYVAYSDILDERMHMDNELMLGLRKIEGINVNTFFEKYGCNIQEEYPKLKDFILNKKIIYKDGYIKVNPKDIYVMNAILVDLL